MPGGMVLYGARGNVFVAGHRSPLAEIWNYFPFEASEITIKTAWAMTIFTTLL